MMDAQQRYQRFLLNTSAVGPAQEEKARAHPQFQLAEKIRAHAYTWGNSTYGFSNRKNDDPITLADNEQSAWFGGVKTYIMGLLTDMDDVMGIEYDGIIRIVFTESGKYIRLDLTGDPLFDDANGNPLIQDVNNPEDAQKPYETHGFN